LSSLLWNRPLPFYAAPAGRLADLHSGQSWETVEPIVFPGLQAPEVVFTVAGETKVNGRNCVRIEKKPKMLPVKNQAGNESISLTDYAGLLLVDRETGLTVRDAWRAGVLYEAGGLQTRVAGGAAIALKETREIPAAEVAARVRQAEALARVEDAAFAADPKADRKQQVDTAEQAIARYRRDYPSSPYAPALATLSAYLEPEARRLALLGAPAPSFQLPDLAGHEQPLAAYHGKLILLCFFASW
jgi:hypothetical protein